MLASGLRHYLATAPCHARPPSLERKQKRDIDSMMLLDSTRPLGMARESKTIRARIC